MNEFTAFIINQTQNDLPGNLPEVNEVKNWNKSLLTNDVWVGSIMNVKRDDTNLAGPVGGFQPAISMEVKTNDSMTTFIAKYNENCIPPDTGVSHWSTLLSAIAQ